MTRPFELFAALVLLLSLVAIPQNGNADSITRIKKPGTVFSDCPECPQMVVIPKGKFMLGSDHGFNDNKPLHRVKIGYSFAVAKFETTFAEWDACVSDGGCEDYRPEDEGWGRGSRPAIHLSWNDARLYVKWLSGKTRETYRLLSEAEWEYAARGNIRTPYYWGRKPDLAKANFANAIGKTTPVGKYPANAFGLFDMHGNVREWVEDCHHNNYHGAPTDGSARQNGDCREHPLRGGSWAGDASLAAASFRFWDSAEERNNLTGFRVARRLSQW